MFILFLQTATLAIAIAIIAIIIGYAIHVLIERNYLLSFKKNRNISFEVALENVQNFQGWIIVFSDFRKRYLFWWKDNINPNCTMDFEKEFHEKGYIVKSSKNYEECLEIINRLSLKRFCIYENRIDFYLKT